MAATGEEDVVTLVLDENTSVTVHYHGATVTSWRAHDQEQLFVSKNAIFDNKKAIRGGIPIVFPNFGPWDCGPQHGFARTTRWSLDKPPNKADDGSISAVFVLEDTSNEEIRKTWNFRFRLEYKLTLKTENFSMDFRVDNTGTDAFDFTCLLHTYFRVPDIHRAGILGLKDCTYVDKVLGEEVIEERKRIGITKNYDRIYKNTSTKHYIVDQDIRRLKIVKCNFPDTVVWNPWIEKAIDMTDFGDDEYLDMICVEVGYVAKPKHLLPGDSYNASQTVFVYNKRSDVKSLTDDL